MPRLLKRHFIVASLTLATVGLGVACIPAPPRLPASSPADVPASIRVQQAGHIRVITLEDYVLGAALSEMTPVGESVSVAARIYEVQAIIARTYAAAHMGRHGPEGFDVCDQTHCQLFQPERVGTSSFGPIAREAVLHTAGRILRFNGRPAEAVFHADCGGYTTTPAVAWGGPAVSYLVAAPDLVAGEPHRNWQFSATTEEWTALLNRDPRTKTDGPLQDLRISTQDASGRAVIVDVVGHRSRQVSGATLRAVVSAERGVRTMMSTRMEIRRIPGGFRLEGTGFGHGVGLCQVGSMARARRGDSVDAILAHYYPGTR